MPLFHHERLKFSLGTFENGQKQNRNQLITTCRSSQNACRVFWMFYLLWIPIFRMRLGGTWSSRWLMCINHGSSLLFVGMSVTQGFYVVPDLLSSFPLITMTCHSEDLPLIQRNVDFNKSRRHFDWVIREGVSKMSRGEHCIMCVTVINSHSTVYKLRFPTITCLVYLYYLPGLTFAWQVSKKTVSDAEDFLIKQYMNTV